MKKLLVLLLLAPCALLAQVPNYVPTDGLVAWYPMNGNALDGSGNAHHGTVTGAALILDRNGTTDAAYSFAGNCSDRIDMDLPEMADNTTFSISFWAKRNGSGCQNPRLWEFFNGDITTQCGWFNSWDYITFSGVPINTSLNDGERFHFTLTEDGQDWRTYVNGELTNTYAKTFVTNSPDFAIGRMNHSAWDSFNGDLDDFAIYNRVLTDEEVTSLYQSSSPEEPCFDFSEVPGEVYVDNGPVILQLGPGESSPQADSNGLVVISEPGLFVLERYMGDAHLSLIQDSSWVDFGDILNGLTPPVSFSFDVRLSGNGGPILATDNGNPSYYNGYWISLDNSQLACNYGDGGWHGGGERRTGRVYSDFAQNEWYHITCVVNGANDFAFYLDGVEQTTSYNDSGFGGGVNFTSDPMKLGHHNAASPGTGAVYAQCFAGDLNNVTVWHRALNGAEAAALQEGGLPEDVTALVAHWDFNGTSGGVVVDGSGLGHDGQLIGNATISTTPQCTTTDTIVVHHSGCTDVAACNYDPTATQDDGSCVLVDNVTPTLVPSPTGSEFSILSDLPDGTNLEWNIDELLIEGTDIQAAISAQFGELTWEYAPQERHGYQFDGDDNIIIETSEYLGGDFSIDLRAHVPQSDGNAQFLFKSQKPNLHIGTGPCNCTSPNIPDEDINGLRFLLRRPGGGWNGIDIPIPDDASTHRYTFTYEASTGSMEIYLDSELSASASFGSNFLTATGQNHIIGSNHGDVGFWEGTLDYVQFIGERIDAQTLEDNSICPPLPLTENTLGFWSFDSDSEGLALDLSEYAHHGVIQGATLIDELANPACFSCAFTDTLTLGVVEVDSGFETPPCGPGTVWDPVAEECIIAIPADINYDGCVSVNDLLLLLAVHGTCPPYPEWPDEPTDTTWACGDPLPYQGYDYSTVQIDDQCWFAENSRHLPSVSAPSNLGNLELDTLPRAFVYGYSSDTTFEATTTAEYSTYGAMYNWAAIELWAICPSGWHVPTDSDWQSLESNAGMSASEVNDIGWHRGQEDALGIELQTNGFQVNSTGGFVHHTLGFLGVNEQAFYWSSTLDVATPSTPGPIFHRRFSSSQEGIYRGSDFNQNSGAYVRCLQN